MSAFDDTIFQEINILKELVLLNLNMQMIPLELEIQGTPTHEKMRLKKLENNLKSIRKEFATLYDQLWSTCKSQGLYVQTTKSFAFGVLHEIKLEILPIPANGKYPQSYAILSNKK